MDEPPDDTETDIGLAVQGCDEDMSLIYSMSFGVGLLMKRSATSRR